MYGMLLQSIMFSLLVNNKITRHLIFFFCNLNLIPVELIIMKQNLD
jgi:hypothetical protein